MPLAFACVVVAACAAPRAFPPVGRAVDQIEAPQGALLVSTHGCSAGPSNAVAPPPISSCAIGGDDAVVAGIVVKPLNGEAFAVHAFGGRMRVYLRGEGSELRFEGLSPIEFSGSLARPPRLRTARAVDLAGVATAREGALIEGSAVGARVVGRALLGSAIELGPITLPCAELRLSTRKDDRDDVVRDDPVLAAKPSVLAVTEGVLIFPSATSDEGVRANVWCPVDRLRTKGARTEISVRTARGSVLRGWVARELVSTPPGGAGFGAGSGSMCGCGSRVDTRPTVRVLPGTRVQARPGGEPWGVVREAMDASVFKEEGKWLQLLSTPHYSEGECEGEAVEHFWVERAGVAPLRPN